MSPFSRAIRRSVFANLTRAELISLVFIILFLASCLRCVRLREYYHHRLNVQYTITQIEKISGKILRALRRGWRLVETKRAAPDRVRPFPGFGFATPVLLGRRCNYDGFSVLYAFATPAAVMSSVITVADVAKPRNVAKSPDAKSDSRHTPPAVVDA